MIKREILYVIRYDEILPNLLLLLTGKLRKDIPQDFTQYT